MHQKKAKNNLKILRKIPFIKDQRAFTLIEVLVSLTILSLIFSMVQVILISTINAREAVQAQTHVDRIGSRLLSMIAQDIHAAYIYQLDDVCFLGKAGREGDRLDFITNTDSLLGSEDGKSDLCEVGYFIKPNPREPGTYKLVRREGFFINDHPLEGGYAIKLYDRVAGFKLQYVDKKGTIKKSWNNKEDGGLPCAVLITLGIYSAARGSPIEELEKSIRCFNTCIPIMVSPQPPENKKKEDSKEN